MRKRLFSFLSLLYPIAAHAGMSEINTLLTGLSQTRADIMDAINFRIPGALTASDTFATFADAAGKICGGTISRAPKSAGTLTISEALTNIFNTKAALKAAIITNGGSVPESTSFSNYSSKIKAINCPGATGYADADIINKGVSSGDDGNFQCENAKVCEVLSDATSCQANTNLASLAQNTACVGSAAASDWVLMYSCNSNCGGTGYPLPVGNIYRIDIRNDNYAKNWIYIPTHSGILYSFQQRCNNVNQRTCVGMITNCDRDFIIASQAADRWSSDYSSVCFVQWMLIPEGQTGQNITVPNTTKDMIMAAQPSGSIRIYKLGN